MRTCWGVKFFLLVVFFISSKRFMFVSTLLLSNEIVGLSSHQKQKDDGSLYSLIKAL
jgi:hypothetical protein